MNTPRACNALVPGKLFTLSLVATLAGGCTTLFTLTLLATLAGGCSGSAEEVGASEGAQTSAGVPAKGEYEMSTEPRYALLTIKSASAASISFDLEAYNNFGSFNQGFLTDATAKGSRGLYTHTSENCKLTFRVASGGIDVEQEGTCEMGASVSAGGSYKPKAKEPAVATLCNTAAAEQIVFSCKTASKKIISICGYKGAAQYRFGTPAKTELELPAQMAPIADEPAVAEGGFISLGGPGAGGAWATFHNGAYDYSVFTINASRGMDGAGRSLGTVNTSGVVVTKQGKKVTLVKCVEEPKSDLPSDLIAPSDKKFDIDLIP